ncbi:macro domain-containing protein [Lactiplantibacillus daowaiensis]|uniref:Macro domain-containing protein n=1 Tax=Lactiplantibacillus daowaiensis TaxID=2559918 RepID=A0ABW1RX65_9LACO|nr:macro domain-containing protein [Lactiplantibacillus daowaiensis]
MLMYMNSNLFDSPAKVLVNTVNTVGVMGKGIALNFKKMYPDMFKQYQKFCENGQLTIGKLWLYKTPNKWILNFPTKKNWRNKSKLSYIEAGLKKFVETYEERGITSIAFPQLGAGNGGLDWETEVKPLMEQYLSKLPIRVYIHIYQVGKENQEYTQPKEIRQWLDSSPTALSYFQVIQDLNDALIADHEFEAKVVKMEPVDGDTKTIHVKHDDKDYFLTKNDIAESWNKLRNNGILIVPEFPSVVIRTDDDHFFEALLRKLPYVKIIHLFYRGQRMDGLQLSKSDLPREEVREASVRLA